MPTYKAVAIPRKSSTQVSTEFESLADAKSWAEAFGNTVLACVVYDDAGKVVVWYTLQNLNGRERLIEMDPL